MISFNHLVDQKMFDFWESDYLRVCTFFENISVVESVENVRDFRNDVFVIDGGFLDTQQHDLLTNFTIHELNVIIREEKRREEIVSWLCERC
jgi:hypothetical protein